jgi:hypothetical protein
VRSCHAFRRWLGEKGINPSVCSPHRLRLSIFQWLVTIAGQVSDPWGYTDYAPPSIASFEGVGARWV